MIAVDRHKPAIVRQLLQAAPDVRIRDANGRTAHDIAIYRNYDDIAQILDAHERERLTRESDKGEGRAPDTNARPDVPPNPGTSARPDVPPNGEAPGNTKSTNGSGNFLWRFLLTGIQTIGGLASSIARLFSLLISKCKTSR